MICRRSTTREPVVLHLVRRQFCAAGGILVRCAAHLTKPRAEGSGARLDSLSVRCLSIYLFFHPFSGDKYAPRFAGARRTAVCAPFLLPLPEIGKRDREKTPRNSEEPVRLNRRGLRTGWSHGWLLLAFALLLTAGVLALGLGSIIG